MVLVNKKNNAAVLDAMRKGRMYAVRQPNETSRLALDEFTVGDGVSGLEATLGESLVAADFPEIRMVIRSTGGKESSAQLKVIRNGEVVKE